MTTSRNYSHEVYKTFLDNLSFLQNTALDMKTNITYKEIFRFYMPLVLNSQMMTLSVPFINLGLSRTPNPELAIAAFSVGFSFMVVLNSPSITARNVSTALISDRASFLFIRKIFVTLGLLISLSAILIALTPLHQFLFIKIFSIPSHIAHEVRRVLLIIFPTATCVAVRTVYQGLALIHKKSSILAYATLIRLTTIILVVFIAVFYFKLPGATPGALGIVTGMGIEALFVYLQARKFFQATTIENSAQKYSQKLTLSEVFHFSYPLLIGIYVLTFLPSLINAIVSRTHEPEMALVGVGVVLPILRFFISPLFGFQSATLVLYRSNPDLKKLTLSVLYLSLFFSSILFVVGYSPIGKYLLTNVFKLNAEIAQYSYPGLLIMFLVPLFMGIRCHAQGILMKIRSTKAISISALSKVLLLFCSGLMLLWLFPGINGVILGVGLLAFGELWDASILGGMSLKNLRSRLLKKRADYKSL